MPNPTNQKQVAVDSFYVAEVVHCHVCRSRYLDRPGAESHCPACGATPKPTRAVVERAGRLERQ